MAPADPDLVYGKLVALAADVSPDEWWFDTPVCDVGRLPGVQIPIPRDVVSRRHARIERVGSRHYLVDLGSANGTYLNDERIVDRVELADYDDIGCGTQDPVLRFRELEPNRVPPARPKYDEAANRFTLGGQPLDVTAEEIALLRVLWANFESVCDRAACASAIWGADHPASLERRALDEVVAGLRAKLWRVNPTGDPIELRPNGYILTG